MASSIGLCIISFIFVLCGCHDIRKTEQQATCGDVHLDTNYKYVNLIPDSLRTPAQKEFLTKLVSIVAAHVKVQDNQMIFTLSKDQLIALGIPGAYYEMIQKNLRDNNKYIEENGIEGVDTIWQNALQMLDE